jgi:very-short-patch-repair endonuclease
MIERLAWAYQIENVDHEQRMALVGWQQTIKRIAGGHGRMVDSHRMEAKKLMAKCKGSVPVWVMPLTRVVENFDPAAAEKFDLVIIDEASQSDLMALIVLYMAKKVIVVGDDEQVSPLGVGQNLDEIVKLIKSNLEGVPNHHLYDGQMSIYNIGQQAFGGTVCLVEHFRSVPEIIHFSNHLSYDGRILPLRESSGVALKPHVLDYRVEADFVCRKVNEKEADHVAALMIACTNMPEYREKTFGVISMVGEEQALHVERLLRRHMPLAELLSRRVSCGNSANFQGDERDVMFLSMVDCKGEEQGPLSKREQKLFKQRYNVAASRAKDQMWVVHSLDPDTDLKQDDLRRRLIKYARDPSEVIRALQQAATDSESVFEEEVAQRLVRAGYTISQQKWVGHYRIDIVVENDKRKIAIECDGDKHHPPEKIAEDMARQAILERLGWRFIRIRGSRFYRDPDSVIKEVFQELEYLGATPDYSRDAGDACEDRPKDNQKSELRDRIVRRAHEILREWDEERERNKRSAEEAGGEQTVTRRFSRRKKGEGSRSEGDELKLL